MTSHLGTNNSAVELSPEEIHLTLAKIIQSKYFIHAPKKQKFVQLICDYYSQGRATELNEYLIGCEVFEKGAGYNPSVDPVVRVGAHDVRKKLDLYYQNEGAADPVRLIVPVGTYVPIFVRACDQATSEKPAVATPILAKENQKQNALPPDSYSPQTILPSRRGFWSFVAPTRFNGLAHKISNSSNRLLVLLGIIILILFAVIIWLLIQNRTSLQQIAPNKLLNESDREIYKTVWGPFLSNNSSTLLILSNPMVYRPVNAADPEALTKQGVTLGSEQMNLIENLSNNRLPIRPNQIMQLVPAANMYTGIGEAIGVFRLCGLLQGIGEVTLLKQSRNVGADDIKDHDVIMLGSVYANQWSKPLSIKENFVYSSRASIENLTPQPGEQREYVSLFDQRTGALLEDYALITVVPGVEGTNMVMSLSGIYSEGTQAAVEYITDKEHLTELNRRLQQLNSKGTPPRYFQALLKVRVENSFPTQIILLTVREL